MHQAKYKRLDMSKELRVVATKIVVEMQKGINSRIDMEGRAVKPNRPLTVKTKKAKGRSRPSHRMIDSGNFIKSAYKITVEKDAALITVKNAKHPESNATYLQIAEWNQKGNNNQSVADASTHFGMTTQTEKKMYKELEKGILKKVSKNITYKALITQGIN